jgi:hypothetical protein
MLRRRWETLESGDDGQENGKEGHEKAKTIRKTIDLGLNFL